jgi:YgiT-type zinc finger domain-containing protein
MTCVICRQAEPVTGITSVSFERGEYRLVIKNVPARICPNCGEAYVDEDVAAALLREAETSFALGMREDIREYPALIQS